MNKNLSALLIALVALGTTCIRLPHVAHAQARETVQEYPLNALRDSLNTLSDRLEATQDRLHTSNSRLNALSDSLRTTQDSLRESNARLDSLNAGLQATQDRLHTSDGRINTLNSRLHATQDSLRESNARLDSLNADLQATQDRLHASDDRLNALNDSLHTLRSGLGKTQGSLDRWTMIIAALILLIACAMALGGLWARKTKGRDQKRFRELDEAILKRDATLAAFLETKTAQATETAARPGPPAEIDHSFPLRVADEITRMENNLLRMDPNVKGHKQLLRSIERVRSNLQGQGYELVELLGKSYNDGLLVEADFAPDENLQPGERVISRVFRPEVRFGGEIIQIAKIQVSQGN